MKRTLITTLAVTVLAGFGVALACMPAETVVEFINGQNEPVGRAQLMQTAQGVLIKAEFSGLPEGWHGFHIHAVGDCTPPGFQSAGAHYNPASHEHGFEKPQGPHAGDLPNIWVHADGTARVHSFAAHVSLDPTAANSLLDADGSALVVHAKPDDYVSQPSGDAGDRIACAVIRKAH